MVGRVLGVAHPMPGLCSYVCSRRVYIVCILWLGGECACAKRQHVFSANINLQTAHVFPVGGYACVGRL